MKILLIAGLILFLSAYSFAQTDTLKVKKEYANIYFKEAQIKSRMMTMFSELGKSFPEANIEDVQKVIEKLDWDKFNDKLLEVTVNLYTLDELKLLADYFGSNIGKSILKKNTEFMKEIMPFVKQEVMRGFEELKKKNVN